MAKYGTETGDYFNDSKEFDIIGILKDNFCKVS